MNNQELFDKVTNHLLTQNEQAFANGNCAYRGKNEQGKVLMCAVGCLIPEDKYDTAMEGKLWNYENAIPLALQEQGIDTNDEKIYDLISKLQDIHDYYTPERWYLELRDVARTFKLEYHGTSL